MGCLLDCDAGTISFTKNGADLGVAFQIPKVAAGIWAGVWESG